MGKLQPSQLRARAGALLENADSPKKIVMQHTAIALGSSLAVSLLQFLLQQGIAGTGGLSGLGTRSILTTAQSFLSVLVMFLLPFWEIGLVRIALGWARGEQVGLRTALEGFRRWGPVLGMKALVTVLFVAVSIALMYFGVAAFLLTPFSASLAELPLQDTTVLTEEMLTPEVMEQMTEQLTPLLIFLGVLFVPVAGFLAFCTRFADYAVMDGVSPMRAILRSFRNALGSGWQLLKLDLSYWWYWLGILLCLAVSWADSWLPQLGVTLPLDADLAYFLCTVLGALMQGVLLWRCEAKRLTVYSLAYDALNA